MQCVTNFFFNLTNNFVLRANQIHLSVVDIEKATNLFYFKKRC